ncbi:MAG: TPM domain-containing protein [Myxococcales bacterium]|nr:TPM domain-containing protein [Myxococcales bacterium]
MFSELEEQRIVRAIANAERDNRGEVQVHVERRCGGDPLARARALYRLAGLEGTTDDTAVLLYVASLGRVSAVYCGAGVHPRADASFWQGVSDQVAAGYRTGQPADGICAALDQIGALLRTLAPGSDTAGNERSDTLYTEKS